MELTTSINYSRPSSMNMNKIMDVLDSASMGVWRLTMCDGKKTRLCASPKMLELLGLERNCNKTEEEIFEIWKAGVCPEDFESVRSSLQKMKAGKNDRSIIQMETSTIGHTLHTVWRHWLQR